MNLVSYIIMSNNTSNDWIGKMCSSVPQAPYSFPMEAVKDVMGEEEVPSEQEGILSDETELITKLSMRRKKII